jgi:phosphoribosylaminoimidazole-succinocarboxamide synthase
MSTTILKTDYKLKNLTEKHEGKVRDIYFVDDKYLAMVVSDRLSAFDAVLPKAIPYKGQVLNQMAAKFLDMTADIVPNWMISTPDPNVTFGHKVQPLKVEMIIRAYITGSAWRSYKAGEREICGVALPEGLKENQKFDQPIITPTTKAEKDENISKEEIIEQGLVSADIYEQIEEITYKLFERGSEYAKSKGLILVDTKYEFGLQNGKVVLIDEIHTPDSSRYFIEESYNEAYAKGENPEQLSKEFVRQWLIDNNFQNLEGQTMPEIPDTLVEEISEKYIKLYEIIIGEKFEKTNIDNIEQRIENNINSCLEAL